MNKRCFKGALFDLDGVVFDTETQYSIFWGRQFREYYPGSLEMEKLIKGQTLTEIYEQYFPDSAIQQEIARRLDSFESNMEFNYIAGFEEFVSDIRANGVKTAVVTSSNIAKMDNVYSKRPEMKLYFDEILTSEDFEQSKPSPDCYQKAAARFGLGPDECVVFEDSFNGLKSGQSARMFVVGLATTNARQDIAQYSDFVVDSFDALDYGVMADRIGK